MSMLKLIHVSCAVLSISGFIGRGLLMIRGSVLLQEKWVKITPHVVDSLLLVSAIMLASQWGWTVLQQSWLLTKIIALLCYIGLGMLALRGGRPRSVRITAWLGAILVFAYIVSVAINKNPIPFVY